jgi:hypothetical protein
MEGTERDLDLGLRGFTSGQPLKPKPRFDEIPNTSALTFSIRKPDNLIGDPCNKRDEDHARGDFISE